MPATLETMFRKAGEDFVTQEVHDAVPRVNVTAFIDDVDHVAQWLSFAVACGAIVTGSAIALAGARAVRGSLLLFGCLFGASFFGLVVQTYFGDGRLAAFAAIAGGAIVGVAATMVVRFGLFVVGGAFGTVLIMASVHLGVGALFFTSDATFWAAIGVVIVSAGVLGLVYRDGLMLLTTSYSGTLFVVLGASHLAGATVDVKQLLWNPRGVVICQRTVCMLRFVAWVVGGAAAAMGQHFVARSQRKRDGGDGDGEESEEEEWARRDSTSRRASRKWLSSSSRPRAHSHNLISSKAYQNRVRSLAAAAQQS
jgi:hypothetical protein